MHRAMCQGCSDYCYCRVVVVVVVVIGWSKEELLSAWLVNPQSVFDVAGVDLPPQDDSNRDFLTSDSHHIVLNEAHLVSSPQLSGVRGQVSSVCEEKECGICYSLCSRLVSIPCDHHFCKDCWQQYVSNPFPPPPPPSLQFGHSSGNVTERAVCLLSCAAFVHVFSQSTLWN